MFCLSLQCRLIACDGEDIVHKIITIEDAERLVCPVYIDVRSPAEFADGHILGAINVPLFENDERALIGTIYAKQGPDRAKEVGLSVVSPKLPELIQSIKRNAPEERPVVVYCWRGGMRSKSMVVMLELAGLHSQQLEGGYKSYRRRVLTRLQNYEFKPEIFVLCGSTGAGKTLLLKTLLRKNVPVIDLEGLANHRGSVFGQVGLGRQISAPQFDACLLEELDKLNQEPFVFVECESKRIGNVYLPDAFFSAMKRGKRMLLETSLEVRIDRLIKEYEAFSVERADEIIASLESLQKRLGKKQLGELKDLFAQKKMREFVRILLINYYDPLYGYEEANKKDQYCFAANGDDLEQAANEIRAFLRNQKRG